MATCRVVNEPAVPKLPNKVVLEMTGEEAVKLFIILGALSTRDQTKTVTETSRDSVPNYYHALHSALLDHKFRYIVRTDCTATIYLRERDHG